MQKNNTSETYSWKGETYLPGDDIPDDLAIAAGISKSEEKTAATSVRHISRESGQAESSTRHISRKRTENDKEVDSEIQN